MMERPAANLFAGAGRRARPARPLAAPAGRPLLLAAAGARLIYSQRRLSGACSGGGGFRRDLQAPRGKRRAARRKSGRETKQAASGGGARSPSVKLIETRRITHVNVGQLGGGPRVPRAGRSHAGLAGDEMCPPRRRRRAPD